jgi:uncharacterized Ntn-hydrolase superfamily protein
VTYSIVARDPDTGELGVGVQSQAFNTGAAVPWARPGIGAIATQSFTDRRYGWRGLELLAEGAPPEDVLARLRSDDNLVQLRQVGMLAADGRSAQWTGGDCVAEAGSARGENWIAQANMVASPRVWEAMGEAFADASGSLAERLMSALEAAEAAGGDWRGRGGAAVLVVPGEGEPWDRVVDLRVEEGDGSLLELRRLLTRALGYRAASRATSGRAAIGERYGLPDVHVQQLTIQDALQDGNVAEAKRLYAHLIEEQPRWADAIRALATLPDFAGLKTLLDE